MADPFRPGRVLEELTDLSLSGQIDEPHARQLEAMLRADAAALRWYRDMVSLQVDLRIMMTAGRSNGQALAGIEAAAKPVVRSREHGAGNRKQKGSRPGSRSPVLGFLDRMMHVSGDTPVATALMWMIMFLCTGMLLTMIIGIIVMVHSVNVPQVAQQPPNLPAPVSRGREDGRGAGGEGVVAPALTVARLIHTAQCQWAAGSHAPAEGDDLEAGRKLVLTSGLAELMFQSGARAVLQGPAALEVTSKMSALLQRGKVTVTAEEPDAHGFEIHTTGMKYKDLGTEFGVLVDKSGEQQVHVFRGSVQAEVARDQRSEVRDQKSGDPRPPTSDLRPLTSPIILSAHEALVVTAPDKPFERIAADETRFVRAIPGPEPFPIFGTGEGVADEQSDPHWWITAVSCEPNFKPQPAVVLSASMTNDPTGTHFLHGSRETAQWISLRPVPAVVPDGCRWTFRTKFDLTGFDPASAHIEMQYAADDFPVELRLNGKRLPQLSIVRECLMTRKTTLAIDTGFVARKNTLEFVIENIHGGVSFYAELKGTARKVLPAKTELNR